MQFEDLSSEDGNPIGLEDGEIDDEEKTQDDTGYLVYLCIFLCKILIRHNAVKQKRCTFSVARSNSQPSV